LNDERAFVMRQGILIMVVVTWPWLSKIRWNRLCCAVDAFQDMKRTAPACKHRRLSSHCSILDASPRLFHQSFRNSQRTFRSTARFAQNQQDAENWSIKDTIDITSENPPSLPTVAYILKQSIRQLEQASVSEATESIVHLLSAALNLDWDTGWNDIIRIMERPTLSSQLSQRCLTLEEYSHFQSLLQRRLQHEPIQYLLGQWDFLDYRLKIRSPLLCPRPETEELVQLVVEYIKKLPQSQTDTDTSKENKASLRILDVGCGTGCIGIALADLLPTSLVTALDIENIAVETARENAALVLKEQVSRYQALYQSATDFTLDSNDDDTRPFDIVVSNPPYIPASDMETLDPTVLEYESATALCGGTDGLDVIRTIVQQLPLWCRTGASCWMEVDPSHPKLIQRWLDEEGEAIGVVFENSYKDLFGLDRFVKLQVIRGR
jgi:release factor glutamine methyltransferase